MKRSFKLLLSWVLGLALGAFALALIALHMLRAAPGEWSHPLRLGPWRTELSVPALMRVATHPLALRLLEGRTLNTRFGPLQWRAAQLVCAPCSVPLAGDEIRLPHVALNVRRGIGDQWRGEFTLGELSQPLRGRWTAQLQPGGAELNFALADTALADAFALFADTIPELQHARIEGRLRLDARLRLPQRQLTLRPHIEGFVVAGLGTEALLNAVPSCSTRPSALKFGTWLPRAVVAAEDQRFYEHPGYDINEMAAAWSGAPQQAERLRGASTITQQLAKLVYTGDSRSPVRKLRELLYAVEMDRTLGKARVLNLYLAIAPWGDGHCGAAAAARHHLRKRADQLTPTEAAWLASLLRNPDRELARVAGTGQVNVERVGWVIHHMRPLPKARRADLVEALALGATSLQETLAVAAMATAR